VMAITVLLFPSLQTFARDERHRARLRVRSGATARTAPTGSD
jgi:hypothetical protein